MTAPIDVACPFCAAQPNRPCVWDQPTDVQFHADRIEAAAVVQGMVNAEAGVPEVGAGDFERAVDADDEV